MTDLVPVERRRVVPREGPPPGSSQDVIDNWLPESAKELILRNKADLTIKMYLAAIRDWLKYAHRTGVTKSPAAQNSMIRRIDEWRELPVHVKCSVPRCGHRPSPSWVWIWYSGLKWWHSIGDPPAGWLGGTMLSEAIGRYCTEMVELDWKPTKAPRAYRADIRAMVDAVDAAPDAVLAPARRDFLRALILVGYYTGGRASDAATYRLGDVEHFPGGVQLTLSASKGNKRKGKAVEHRTVHSRRDREDYDPRYDGVVALDRWVARLADAGIRTGPLFRPVHKSGVIVRGVGSEQKPGPDRAGYKMDTTGITRQVRLAAQLAGMRNYLDVSFHSLRRGRVNDLIEAGADQWDIENELGWAHGGAIIAYREESKRQSPEAANARAML